MGIFSAFALAPIARGFVILLIAGAVFPAVGIFVFRLNLINVRFMLMHGGLLGGSVALALGINPLILTLAINIILIFVVSRMGGGVKRNYGYVTTFLMVLTMGLAFLIIYKAGVPAKDAMVVLWGNILALTPFDAWLSVGFAAFTAAFVLVYYRKLVAVLFHREVAFASGINEGTLHSMILFLIGLTVSLCMRLIGALLLDAIVLLPAAIGMLFAKSARGLLLIAGISGLAASGSGFIGALAFDIPVSSGIIIVASIIWVGAFVRKKILAASKGAEEI